MREILFREKTKQGDWVYWNELGEINFDLTDTEISLYVHLLNDELMFKTIGQYTGLTDKNGKKIFEGDIVLFEDECAGNYEYHDCTEKRCGVIVYDCGQFFLTNRIAVEMEDLIYDNKLDGQVVGNIHDNPELLKNEE